MSYAIISLRPEDKQELEKARNTRDNVIYQLTIKRILIRYAGDIVGDQFLLFETRFNKYVEHVVYIHKKYYEEQVRIIVSLIDKLPMTLPIIEYCVLEDSNELVYNILYMIPICIILPFYCPYIKSKKNPCTPPLFRWITPSSFMAEIANNTIVDKGEENEEHQRDILCYDKQKNSVDISGDFVGVSTISLFKYARLSIDKHNNIALNSKDHILEDDYYKDLFFCKSDSIGLDKVFFTVTRTLDEAFSIIQTDTQRRIYEQSLVNEKSDNDVNDKEDSTNPFVYAYDIGAGPKKYIVSKAYGNIYDRITEKVSIPHIGFGHKYMNELMMPNKPIRLVLDLEYDQSINETSFADDMTFLVCIYVLQILNSLSTTEFIESMPIQYLNDIYTIEDIILLVSDKITSKKDDNKKISRHCILPAKWAYFKDPTQANNFLRYLHDKIIYDNNTKGSDSIASLFFVYDKKKSTKKDKLIIDTGIYADKRCLRSLWAEKLSDPGRRFELHSNSPFGKKMSKKELFLRTCIGFIPELHNRHLKTVGYDIHSTTKEKGFSNVDDLKMKLEELLKTSEEIISTPNDSQNQISENMTTSNGIYKESSSFCMNDIVIDKNVPDDVNVLFKILLSWIEEEFIEYIGLDNRSTHIKKLLCTESYNITRKMLSSHQTISNTSEIEEGTTRKWTTQISFQKNKYCFIKQGCHRNSKPSIWFSYKSSSRNGLFGNEYGSSCLRCVCYCFHSACKSKIEKENSLTNNDIKRKSKLLFYKRF